MSHSPLPFRKGDKYESWTTEITDNDGRTIAVVWTHGIHQPHKPDEKGLANLDLLVNAVNHHEKLVASLEQCLKLIEDEGFNTRHDTVSRAAREVLESIKGEPVVIAPPEPARVWIEVSCGVAHYESEGNVIVELTDYDDLEAELEEDDEEEDETES